MISQSFYSFISSDAGIRAITASIYPQMLPLQHQGFPAITFAKDSDDNYTYLDGTTDDLEEALFSVDCWDKNYLSAHALADAVKLSLIGLTGTFGTNTVQVLRKDREIELYESDTQLHRVSLQFYIAYS